MHRSRRRHPGGPRARWPRRRQGLSTTLARATSTAQMQGLYYDAGSGGYYSSSTQQWYSYDAAAAGVCGSGQMQQQVDCLGFPEQ